MLLFIKTAFLLWTTLNSISGDTVTQTFRFTRNILSLDGTPKSVIVVNNIFPGPVIHVNAGDTLRVRVLNQLNEDESLSIHWHGISQRGSPWFDGTSFVTNCPIIYGSSITYEFLVESTGTFWYHGHVGATRAEGGYGFLIVRNNSSTSLTDDRFIIISDWYHANANDISSGLLSPKFSFPGNGDAVLLNGVGSCSTTISAYSGRDFAFHLINTVFSARFL